MVQYTLNQVPSTFSEGKKYRDLPQGFYWPPENADFSHEYGARQGMSCVIVKSSRNFHTKGEALDSWYQNRRPTECFFWPLSNSANSQRCRPLELSPRSEYHPDSCEVSD